MCRVKYCIEFIFIFILNAWMYWFLGGYFNLLLGFAMLIFLTVTLAMVPLVLPKIEAKIEIPAPEFTKNTEFKVRIRVKNNSMLPVVRCTLFLQIGNAFFEQIAERIVTLSLAAKGEEIYEISLCSALCGELEIALKHIGIEDYLCLQEKRKSCEKTESIYILPVEEEAVDFEQNDYAVGLTETTESSAKGSDFSEVGQVREYIPGDSLKDIHWKLSAKREALMVKERLQMSSQKLQIVLCCNRKMPKRADEVICFLYELGMSVMESRIPVTLYWWSSRGNELCEKTVNTKEEWNGVMQQIFFTRGGDEAVVEAFQMMAQGQEYLKVSEEM
ncbi:MAG: DUF58 domain-containing protein, partial [Eubacterium sp.]